MALSCLAAMPLAAQSGSPLFAVNAGGPAVSPFVADVDFVGGSTISHANTINTSNVTNPAPTAVYQTARISDFTYTIGGLTAGTNYVVRLHFCETWWSAAGQREFNVTINGTQVLTNFDIFAAAGGTNIANIQQFTLPANSAGQFVIAFISVVNNSLVSGIEVYATGSCSAPTVPTALSASAPSSSQINLSWTASSSTCAGITYNIFRSTTSGFTPSSTNQIASGVSATSYADSNGLAASTTYYYVVEGTNLGGTSGPSNQASATTLGTCVSPNYGSGFTSTCLTLNGSAEIVGTSLQLTDGGGGEARSAFFNVPVNVQSFTSDLSFQLTSAQADGFTFTIQGNSPTALGKGGGGLGYTGISNSLAVGFQLYSSVLGYKEVSLTGDWTNGAAPDATPGTDTTGSGVNLHSGDVMSVHMTYDGTTLTWTITDTTTNKTFTKSVTINIPALTGNTAYVGFTGGTGGLTATQDILNWTFESGSVPPPPPCTAPTAPTNLAASAVSSSQINLSWTASSSTCAGITYNIFRSTSAGFTPSSANQIASGVSLTSYADTNGLAASTTYYYLVEGTNAGGTSGPSNQAGATTQATTSPLFAVNAGGPAVSPFVADVDFVGGTTISHANTIDTSKVTNPAPAAVYQTGRIGIFTYTIGGLTAGTNYLVRLHFCETWWGAAGQREFNVTINGTQVLTNFDIFVAAGGQNIANIQQFTEPANSSGKFVIGFATVIDNSLINGIEIDSSMSPDFSFSAAPSTQPVAAGSQTTYTVTVNAQNGFKGNVALSASGLPSGATSSFSPASISGSGNSTLTVSTSSSTPGASSTLTLTGKSGSLSHSAAVTLIVAVGSNDQLAAQIVSEMTLDQIATELHGIEDANDDRVVPGISSLGIPLLNITNGPAGVGWAGPGHGGDATALPAPISLAATWDVNLANQYGTMIGAEAKDLANGFVEGPDINIARTLQNGRTFESFGEDPYLVGQIAVAEIGGIQSQGVIAESKHFAANNQETDRGIINENIDERTLREIYLPAFETTVKQGNVGAVMCAYNQVTVSNGPSGSAGFMCENSYLLNKVLKQQWGFNGFVTSDFGATHSTVGSANAGLDLEMPTGGYFVTLALQTAITNDQLTMATIDDKLMRRFATMMQFNIFQNPPTFTGISQAAQQSDGAIARQIAEAGMVLLQNNGGILPLKASSLHNIAVIGPYAGAAMTGGGGSSYVTPLYTVSPVTGIQNRVGATVAVNYADGSNISTATSLAQAADVAIVMVGDNEQEGYDDSIYLSGTQDSLVDQVVAAQPKTIVVVKSGTGILMPWASSVPAILEAWYPGEEDGNAVAAVLFGDVNPSGKLPLTFPVNASDPNPPADSSLPAQYPGVNQKGVACSMVTVDTSCTATYSEGVFVGYRHYDENNITPLFPFGYGLSYTTFSFKNLAITPTSFTFTNNPSQTVTVTFNVTNTGTVTGAEVAQLYVAIPSPSQSVPEPPKWLKGFQKTSLTPSQQGQVQLTLDERSFAYWDVNSENWLVAPGTYQIMVGDSSRNILLQGQVTIY